MSAGPPAVLPADSTGEFRFPRYPPRAPAVPVALAFAAGIAGEHWCPLPLTLWLLITGAALLGWMAAIFVRAERPAVLLLCGICCGLGGARLHQYRHIRPADSIDRYVTSERRLIRLVGTVASPPTIRPASTSQLNSAWQQLDSTICTLDCRRIHTEAGPLPVSGRVRMYVSGHLLHAEVGQAVEVGGWISRPRGPQNPGQFDFREYLQREQIACVLFVEHPDAVQLLHGNEGWHPPRTVARIRQAGEQLLIRHLDAETVPIASALLLGERSAITTDQRDSFARSGMMHVLAVSGLHVGILAGFVWFACRILRVSPTGTALVIVAVVAGYAVLTGGRPPVLRAAVLVVVTALGHPWNRHASLNNTLAISAVLVLAWNPTGLFETGTQLSFLAVIAILWSSTWRLPALPQTLASAAAPQASFWSRQRPGGRTIRRIGRAYVMVGAIWLFTAPLIAARFHLVSPIGLIINVLLMPLVVALLWVGFSFLLVGFLAPPLAGWFGGLFDMGLRGFVGLVDLAASGPFGHAYVAGPPELWLIGFYLLLGAVVWVRWSPRWHVRAWGGVWAWSVAGLIWALVRPLPATLTCTFLSVGHGCAILLELPDGRTVLYDAGAIDDGQRAARIVQEALWAGGRTRVDAVILSHADVDHFNAVPRLLETVQVRTIITPRQFLDLEQPAVVTLCESVKAADVPVRLAAAGDEILADPRVRLQVLHPPPQADYSDDNAASLVLMVEYAGRRILLTGDLEEDGLRQVLSDPIEPTEPVDVLLAPHHGSAGANTSELARWANPQHVVISAGGRRISASTLESYQSIAVVHHTHEVGAVRVVIDADGDLRLTTAATGFAGDGSVASAGRIASRAAETQADR